MANITHEEKLETQKRILRAAFEVFSEKGIQKASIREIAKKAGVGASTLYGYYPSKPELFMETMLPSIETQKLMSDKLNQIDLNTATFDEIVTCISEAIFFLPKSMFNINREIIRDLHMVIFTTFTTKDEIRERTNKFIEDRINLILEAFFQKMINEKRFKVEIDPMELSVLLTSIMRLIFLEYVILSSSEEESKAKLERSIRLILIGKL